MHSTLHLITDQFLADKAYHRIWNERIRNRLLRLPNLVLDINDFAIGRISLGSFRISRLQHDLPQQAWDSSNQKNSREWLLAELTTLCRYNSRSAEQTLRDALRGLNRANVGQRIEQLHNFLAADQLEFRRLKKRGRPMAPLNAALMVTLFASMLDPQVYFCDVYLRRGLAILLRAELLVFRPARSAIAAERDLLVHNDELEIRSYEDYVLVEGILDNLKTAEPQLDSGPAWAEIFTRWINDHQEQVRLAGLAA